MAKKNEEVQDIDKFIFKVTLAKLWIIITVVGTLLTSAVGFGVWTTNEAAKVTASKVLQQHTLDLQKKDLVYMELEKISKGFEEDSKFYKKEYDKTVDRLKDCQESNPFVNKE